MLCHVNGPGAETQSAQVAARVHGEAVEKRIRCLQMTSDHINTSSEPTWPSQPGMAGELVRTRDWSETVLGPSEHWPDSLRASVDLVLACSFPMVLLWGPSLIQIYNDAYSAIMGEKHPAGMGQSTRECWPESWEFNRPIYVKVQAGETLTFQNQLFPITRHGFQEEAYFTLCYSPLRHSDSAVAGILITVFETTAQVLADAARKQTDQDLRRMIESTPQISWTADAHGRIVDFSERWLRVTGLTREEALLNGWTQIVPPEDLPAMSTAWQASVSSGEPYDCVHRIQTVSGELCWMRSRAHAARDEWDCVVRWYGTTEDIHERKLAEEALRASEERFRLLAADSERQRAELETVYQTAPIGLALFDTKDFRYLRLNDLQAGFFGMEPEQVVGQTLTEMAPIEGLNDLFKQVLEGTPVINYPLEGALTTAPDQYRYWTVNYFPVYAPDGSIRAITAASLEVTAQRKAELALLQTEKLAVVGRLAASIAHEINNPLESVTNLLYLARSAPDLAEVQEYIDTADRELRRVSAISNQTLRFYRQSTKPRDVTCEDLLESVLSIYQGKIVNSSVEVKWRMRAVDPIHCLDGEIRQVLSNLVGNAIDAMHPNGGKLFLRSRRAINWRTAQHGVLLTIADTGSGMSAEVREKVFEAFYTTKGIGGTGLGLWVSKEIVDRHQGTLQVRSSQQPGPSGTTFALFLPSEPAAITAAA